MDLMGFPIPAFSEKVDVFNSRGILHEAISEKKPEKTTHDYPKCFLCKNHAVIHPRIEGNNFGQL